METKICSKCGERKPLEDFTKDRRKRGGYASRCKACHRALMNGLYAQSPERRASIAANHRLRRIAHPQTTETGRRERDPEGARAYSRAHQRVRRARGSASQHVCLCGADAMHWALDCEHPTIKRSVHYLWSDDITAYRPRCASCNAREDAARRRAEAANSPAGREP